MGHHDPALLDRAYQRLQTRLDRMTTGAPDSPALQKILRILFPPGDVELAARLPYLPEPADKLALRVEMPEAELTERLTAMAQRGLVVDLEHRGVRYFSLAPLALGFFEFTFMRVRDDIPQAELARLFEEYMQEGTGYHAVFCERTQIGRTLAYEETIEDGSEILDWERASEVVQSASTIAVSLCACRHKAGHLGRACDRPQDVCLSLNFGAEHVLRSGFGDRIDAAQGMRVLERSKEAGLVQIADNVQRRVHYLCNCCGCCCAMFQAVKAGGIRGAITTSNWIARVDAQKCNGCGRCAAACPLDAIETVSRNGREQPRVAVSPADDVCIGCGVCAAACSRGALRLHPRKRRVLPPETIFDRLALMAIERGRLGDFLLDQPGGLGWRAVGRIVALLEKTSLVKSTVAVEPLRSAFLSRIVAATRRRLDPFGEVTA